MAMRDGERPSLPSPDTSDVTTSAVIELIRIMWADDPSVRPEATITYEAIVRAESAKRTGATEVRWVTTGVPRFSYRLRCSHASTLSTWLLLPTSYVPPTTTPLHRSISFLIRLAFGGRRPHPRDRPAYR